jgi:lysophospholipase L1-like esterase
MRFNAAQVKLVLLGIGIGWVSRLGLDGYEFKMFSSSNSDEMPFFVKNCRAPGDCHEQPDVPTPRTPFSAWTAEQLSKWFRYQMNLVAVASTAVATSSSPILFLGDSITEAFVGTSYGASCAQPNQRCEGVPAAWEKGFKFATTHATGATGMLALGISGDQTQHLLWRLQSGELPPGLAPPTVFVLIGTNNLGSGMSAAQTLKGVVAVVELVRLRLPASRVVLFGLLPRGEHQTSPEVAGAVGALLEVAGVGRGAIRSSRCTVGVLLALYCGTMALLVAYSSWLTSLYRSLSLFLFASLASLVLHRASCLSHSLPIAHSRSQSRIGRVRQREYYECQ